MCSVGLALGGVQAVGGVMSAMGQHNAQKAAVARQNQIQQQQYQQQLRMQQEKDRVKKEKHAADLANHAQALNDFQKQLEVTQLETNRAMSVAKQKQKERNAKASFEMQAAIASSIQAQGATLSTGNAGQSFLLQVEQNKRELGFATAQLEQQMLDTNRAHHMEGTGILMQQYSQDAKAYSSLPGTPQAQRASFLPYKPIPIAGPSKMALMGNMIGAIGSGASTAVTTQRAIQGPEGKLKLFG
tara:strand:- start:7211 stop:7939 length:729 start_codon:yes stop_codon:yes gene_type:complete